MSCKSHILSVLVVLALLPVTPYSPFAYADEQEPHDTVDLELEATELRNAETSINRWSPEENPLAPSEVKEENQKALEEIAKLKEKLKVLKKDLEIAVKNKDAKEIAKIKRSFEIVDKELRKQLVALKMRETTIPLSDSGKQVAEALGKIGKLKKELQEVLNQYTETTLAEIQRENDARARDSMAVAGTVAGGITSIPGLGAITVAGLSSSNRNDSSPATPAMSHVGNLGTSLPSNIDALDRIAARSQREEENTNNAPNNQAQERIDKINQNIYEIQEKLYVLTGGGPKPDDREILALKNALIAELKKLDQLEKEMQAKRKSPEIIQAIKEARQNAKYALELLDYNGQPIKPVIPPTVNPLLTDGNNFYGPDRDGILPMDDDNNINNRPNPPPPPPSLPEPSWSDWFAQQYNNVSDYLTGLSDSFFGGASTPKQPPVANYVPEPFDPPSYSEPDTTPLQAEARTGADQPNSPSEPESTRPEASTALNSPSLQFPDSEPTTSRPPLTSTEPTTGNSGDEGRQQLLTRRGIAEDTTGNDEQHINAYNTNEPNNEPADPRVNTVAQNGRSALRTPASTTRNTEATPSNPVASSNTDTNSNLRTPANRDSQVSFSARNNTPTEESSFSRDRTSSTNSLNTSTEISTNSYSAQAQNGTQPGQPGATPNAGQSLPGTFVAGTNPTGSAPVPTSAMGSVVGLRRYGPDNIYNGRTQDATSLFTTQSVDPDTLPKMTQRPQNSSDPKRPVDSAYLPAGASNPDFDSGPKTSVAAEIARVMNDKEAGVEDLLFSKGVKVGEVEEIPSQSITSVAAEGFGGLADLTENLLRSSVSSLDIERDIASKPGKLKLKKPVKAGRATGIAPVNNVATSVPPAPTFIRKILGYFGG